MTVIVFIAICGAIIVFSTHVSTKREPLTPDQILEKKEWTKDELADTLIRMEFQRKAHNQAMPQNVYNHLGAKLGAMSEKDRDDVIVKTITVSIGKGLALFRTLEPGARKTLMADMMKDAEASGRTVRTMNKDDKEEIRSKAKEVYKTAVDEAMLNKATPDERREFAPIVKEWVAMLEALQ